MYVHVRNNIESFIMHTTYANISKYMLYYGILIIK